MKITDTNNYNTCEDIIKCIFELNELDIKVYKILQKTGEIRADEIAKELKKDRSTIYRSLQKLTCSKIIIKKTKNIEKGGYYHTYSCKDNNTTKQELEKCINNWYKQMKNTIKELE